MDCHGTVDSLLNCCMYAVVKNLRKYSYDMSEIPINVKERMTKLLCKRGLVSDQNVKFCLYSGLIEIDLSECIVGDDTLLAIADACPHLLKIDLNATKGKREEISTSGVVALSKGCPAMQTLYLRRCVRVSDEAIIAVSKNCTKLKELNVGGCSQISDLSLEGLGANSGNLSSLNVSGTSITDSGLLCLCNGSPQRSLVELHINNCMNLTDDSVNHVIASCPSIKILLLHGCPKMTDATRVAIDQLSSRMRQVTWTIY